MKAFTIQPEVTFCWLGVPAGGPCTTFQLLNYILAFALQPRKNSADKKISAFYRTQNFYTVFRTAHLTGPEKTIPHSHAVCLGIVLILSYMPCIHRGLFFSGISVKKP
jgi:hypothetical protein